MGTAFALGWLHYKALLFLAPVTSLWLRSVPWLLCGVAPAVVAFPSRAARVKAIPCARPRQRPRAEGSSLGLGVLGRRESGVSRSRRGPRSRARPASLAEALFRCRAEPSSGEIYDDRSILLHLSLRQLA